ncbi:CHAD domain-containing protein [Leifsonia sp. PS1209]|uniref:CHAD domain-containing protein n=1 Tax=Leifsonia sp. PS1209 TaxID=2724914 RepID=UPI001FF94DA6|nr:CHAD domain-containing protein [Leifsonia sp. PS1209]
MFSLVAVSAELAEQLVAIETGGDDAVHQARTRVRRLRSILGVYRRAFEKDDAKRLRRRLRALGTRLGVVRDLEVLAEALDGLAADPGLDTPTMDAVVAFAADARSAHAAAVTRLLSELSGRSDRRLVADTVSFAAAPPLSSRGADHPRKTARKGLRRAARRVTAPADASLEAKHTTRKAARRLRYAAEAVADLFGRDAVRLAAAAEALQDALGDHRDLVLLAAHLRQKAEDAELSPAAAAGVERLASACEQRADERLAGLDDLVAGVADAL